MFKRDLEPEIRHKVAPFDFITFKEVLRHWLIIEKAFVEFHKPIDEEVKIRK